MSNFWKPEIDYDLVEEFKARNKEQEKVRRELAKEMGYIDVHADMRIDEANAAITHNYALTLTLASRGGG